MPEISRFYGIVVAMFNNEHNPPHFHARYGKDQVAIEITRHIKRGKKNEVIFVSRKNYGSRGRASASAMDYFRVVIGAGFESRGQIVLKHSLLESRRTAAQTRAVFTEKHRVILR